LHKGNQGSLASLELVGHLQDNYLSQDVSAVFERGLHEFIQEVLDQLRTMAQQIEIDFRFYE
jgi:hypothetical protein